MTVKRKIFIGGLLLLTIVISFVGYELCQFISFVDSMGECGMSAGPVYGQKINIKLNNLKIDTYLTLPDGQFAISNTLLDNNSTDTIPPILIRLNKKRDIVWAVSLDSKVDSCVIPLFNMNNIQLVDDKNGKRISFFNVTYMEPGTIFLKENYDFDYVCLNPI